MNKLKNTYFARPQTAQAEPEVKWDIERAIKAKVPRNANAIKADCKFIKKTAPTSIAEIEKNLWKNNISFNKR